MINGIETSEEIYKSKGLDHLGLVAGMYEEMGIGSVVNQALGEQPGADLSMGMRLKSMIVNGLGFTTRPLYLSGSFFETKAVDLLLGPGVRASQITDASLGRFLDQCYDYGAQKLFSQITWSVFNRYELGGSDGFVHLDTTSMSVHGQYKEDSDALNITFGHSKDHRPDLKQFVISLMVEPRHGIPWLFDALDGNTSDKAHFQSVIAHLSESARNNSDQKLYLVADSALYTQAGLEQIKDIYWLTRVPHSYRLAKDVVAAYGPRDMSAEDEQGYAYRELAVSHLGIHQRWLVIWSRQAYYREKKSLRKAWRKEQLKIEDQLKALRRKEFHCEEDAQEALEKLSNKWKYHTVNQTQLIQRRLRGKRGRPKKGETPTQYRYRIEATACSDPQALRKALKPLGKFVLATNELNQQALPADQILGHYKEQHQVEKGFRFLKSPLCMAEAVFLKKPERIVALTMVMCLALMVYAMAERKLRTALKEREQTIPDQKKRPYQKPTMRWVFQCFAGIEVLYIYQNNQLHKQQVLNLKELHIQIITLMGKAFEKIYLSNFSP